MKIRHNIRKQKCSLLSNSSHGCRTKKKSAERTHSKIEINAKEKNQKKANVHDEEDVGILDRVPLKTSNKIGSK